MFLLESVLLSHLVIDKKKSLSYTVGQSAVTLSQDFPHQPAELPTRQVDLGGEESVSIKITPWSVLLPARAPWWTFSLVPSCQVTPCTHHRFLSQLLASPEGGAEKD